MTIWQPELEEHSGPKYRRIVDALASDVAHGVLEPGARLPTHRDLADRLGVTVGTVSRAYAEAERRGLTVGHVGRGTFVRQRSGGLSEAWPPMDADGDGVTDLSMSLPVSLDEMESAAVSAALTATASADGLHRLLHYRPDTGLPHHRNACAALAGRVGFDVEPERVVLTAGAQHALTALLPTLLAPGDVLLTAQLTYPGIKAAATRMGVRLRGVALDEEGILPGALDAALRDATGPRVLYVIPTVQNPTGGSLSVERRRALVDVARAHDATIVEDDIHGLLPDDPLPPLATFAPERTYYATSLTKVVAMGLRVGFMVAPPDRLEQARAAVRASLWMPPPLSFEVATRWLADGTADRIIQAKKAEVRERRRMAEGALEGYALRSDPSAYYVWLELPAPWRSDDLVERARARGVLLAGEDVFAVGRTGTPSVRICLGIPRSRAELAAALETVASILSERPVLRADIV